MTYRIKLDVFEGPFDLLLHLIKINEMDIYDIKISEITKQYLDYIRLMESLDLEIAGEYLVMAATLINIKARTLLPVHEEENVDEEIDEIMSTKELIRQLVEYRKYKELAKNLKNREEQNLNVFYRTNIVPIFQRMQKTEETEETKEDIKKLFEAFGRVINIIDKKHIHHVQSEEYSIDDKITYIRTIIDTDREVLLNKIIQNCSSKAEIIVTFLASLELVRLKEVRIAQASPYQDIFLVKRDKDQIIDMTEEENVLDHPVTIIKKPARRKAEKQKEEQPGEQIAEGQEAEVIEIKRDESDEIPEDDYTDKVLDSEELEEEFEEDSEDEDDDMEDEDDQESDDDEFEDDDYEDEEDDDEDGDEDFDEDDEDFEDDEESDNIDEDDDFEDISEDLVNESAENHESESENDSSKNEKIKQFDDENP